MIYMVDKSATEERRENMVDTELLEKAILDSGKKKGYLAERIGRTVQTFKGKTSGAYDFTTTEVEILCKELGITSLEQKERIFFARKVDKSATSDQEG
jgi:hypothetical protein